VVVVDNGSTTPVVETPGITVVRSPDRLSAGAARNLGLERVETECVVFLDADDVIAPGTLDFLAAQLDSRPEAAASVTSILEADTGLRHRTPRRFVIELAHHPRLLAVAHSVWSLYPTQGCTMMRTRWARDAGGYGDASGGEDWVIGASLAFRGPILVSDRIGLHYHAGEASLWSTNRSTGDLKKAAGLVRRRIRTDPGVPGWARLALPVIALLQLLAINGVRPAYLAIRALRASGAAPGQERSGNVDQGPDRPPQVGKPESNGSPAREC
jgi:glycosyltransferase involved in cell wall biosynthesis